MFAKITASRRHKCLMTVATILVRDAEVSLIKEPADVLPEQVVHLAFGRHQLCIEQTDAVKYLAAALVARGHNTGHLPVEG